MLERLEQKDWTLARSLVARCAELGLLGVDVAEEYGGVHLDKVTSVIVSEQMSMSASFGATFGAHANLVVLPLVALRNRGAEAAVPAAPALRGADRRLLPERAGIRVRRARREDARDPPA